MSSAPPTPSLAAWRGRHAGETIVVCGCGRSLADLPHPERWLTIGVNDVGRLFDPTYLVVVNPRRQFRGDRFRHVAASRARAFFTQLDPGRDLGIAHPCIVRFRLGRRGGTELDDPDALPYARNSPYVAVCLAAFLGARRIGLIGVDFTDHHFFAATGAHPLARELAQIDREYGRLAPALGRRGVELVNLSPQSRLTALPKVPAAVFLSGTDGAAAPAPGSQPDAGAAPEPPTAAGGPPRVFFVHYQFLSCGDVFTRGLESAARDLGLAWAGAAWDDPRLAEAITRFAPDLLFVVHGRRFRQRWGDRFRGLRSAVWLLDEPYEVDDTERTSRGFDVVFVNDPATLGRHRNAHYLPVAWDPHRHATGPDADRRYDVGFVGGGNPARETMLLRLAREGLLSYVVGSLWRSRELQALALGANVTPDRTAELYRQTRLVVNVFRDRHHFNRRRLPATALNPRVYEALACGALVVSEDRPELAEVFPELPRFAGAAGLVAAVRELLADPERSGQRLAACRQRLAPHTYAERLRAALEIALSGAVSGRGEEALIIADETPTLDRGGASLPAGWRAVGEAAVRGTAGEIVLDKPHDDWPGSEGGVASDAPLGNVELAFEVMLGDAATFIAKLHQQDREDQATNSYHLLCSPAGDYLGMHNRILRQVRVTRGRWHAAALRWFDGRLELVADGQLLAAVAAGDLESGYCFLGTKGGEVRLRKLRLSVPETAGAPAGGLAPGPPSLRGGAPAAPARARAGAPRGPAHPRPTRPGPGRPLASVAFSRLPLRNLLYHVWPVSGSIWPWNVEQLKQRIDVFNGRRIVGVVVDGRSDPPEAVMSQLEGHGCEFVVRRNDSRGEVVTFPQMLCMVSSLNPDEITLYGHAKGVKYGAAVTDTVRRWAELQYRTSLDDWPTIWKHLQRYALTGPLRMLGRFRAHHNLTDWHYSGTFFWLRHAHVFSRPVFDVPQFYGGVEVWPALYFSREETGCLFLDELRQLPYHTQFWSTLGNQAFGRWQASREVPRPPRDLVDPRPFEGHTWPRTEQKPEELGWWIETLLAAGVRRLLSIGVMHGGVEWHVARVFRQHGKDIEITAVDRQERPDARRSFADAAERFGQPMRLIAGDSSSPETRRQLGESYDAVFIDGDHGYRGARADWAVAQAVKARVVGFHDIVDSHWHVANRCCVTRLWSEIKAAHRTAERCSEEWGGIGVVWP